MLDISKSVLPLLLLLIVIGDVALPLFQLQKLGVCARRQEEFLHSATAHRIIQKSQNVMSATATAATTIASTNKGQKDNQNLGNNTILPILMVFSDVDGTLVHYPDQLDVSSEDESKLLKLPPSRTGLQGIISVETLRKCQILRIQHGVKLVLISGMRTSTMMQRLPFLPKADAYCCENGGRIFYPVDPDPDQYHGRAFKCIIDGINGASDESFQHSDHTSFGLVEDLEWRGLLEQEDSAGPDGYQGEIDDDMGYSPIIPVEQRHGILWEFAKKLISLGFVLDWQGYATCFRVNRKQQTSHISDDMFQALATSTDSLYCPPGLIRSTNLGHIDFAPACSGKRNCCQYLASKFMEQDGNRNSNGEEEIDWLASVAVCWCDDDNDLEMALACRHVFVPSISSASMASIIQKYPDHFTFTGEAKISQENNVYCTKGTEQAIERTMELIRANKVATTAPSNSFRP